MYSKWVKRTYKELLPTNDNNYYECPYCLRYTNVETPYCPYCGKKMFYTQMSITEAINILKKDKALCTFNPTTGELTPPDSDCAKSAEALDIAITILSDTLKDF